MHRVLKDTAFDAAFCFDELEPTNRKSGALRSVLAAMQRDQDRTGLSLLPIVHAPRTGQGEILSAEIPSLMREVARTLRPALIAIPERELGGGILQRARTVYEIRRELDELGFYQPLHLLGTGNPLSMAIFAAVGADCFDGLEWCRVASDAESGKLFHFHQADFFMWQSEVSESPVVREAMNSPGVEYSGKVVFHNLDFYRRWMSDLRKYLPTGKIERFLSSKLPRGTSDMSLLEKAIPEVFR